MVRHSSDSEPVLYGSIPHVLKGNDHLEVQGIDGGIILRFILEGFDWINLAGDRYFQVP